MPCAPAVPPRCSGSSDPPTVRDACSAIRWFATRTSHPACRAPVAPDGTPNVAAGDSSPTPPPAAPALDAGSQLDAGQVPAWPPAAPALDAGSQLDAGQVPASPRAVLPPAPHVCGPDIDTALTNVLVKIQRDFAAAETGDKRMACWNLHIPPMAIMAWDILDLFLPHTSWVNNTVACATPLGAEGVEDPQGCTNSVWAGGHCHLAGTANYATWGIVQKLCFDFVEGDSWWMRPMVNWHTEGMTSGLISTYKALSTDDTGPPTEWAFATYRGGPTARPAHGNRDGCSRCGGPATGRVFDYSWSPIHGSLNH